MTMVLMKYCDRLARGARRERLAVVLQRVGAGVAEGCPPPAGVDGALLAERGDEQTDGRHGPQDGDDDGGEGGPRRGDRPRGVTGGRLLAPLLGSGASVVCSMSVETFSGIAMGSRVLTAQASLRIWTML